MDELQNRMDEVPPGKEVIAYCRGPYCVYSDQALAILSTQGFRAARLEEGVIEWQEAGLPLERPSAP